MSDFHDILGVEKGASTSEIKKAYRARALAVHPDVNDSPEAQKLFIELAKAYETLTSNNYRDITQPQQKYWDVYQPPLDEREYEEWKKVDEERRKFHQEKARERAYQKRKKFEEDVQRFRKSILYYPLMSVYYIFLISFLFSGILSLLIPIYVKLNASEYNFTNEHILLMTCCITPISFTVFLYLKSLKKDIDPLFGLDRK